MLLPYTAKYTLYIMLLLYTAKYTLYIMLLPYTTKYTLYITLLSYTTTYILPTVYLLLFSAFGPCSLQAKLYAIHNVNIQIHIFSVSQN